MGSMSPLHWLLVLAVVVLLFGGNRLSTVMGDFAKGIKSFKKHMAEDETMDTAEAHRPLAAPGITPAGTVTSASHVPVDRS